MVDGDKSELIPVVSGEPQGSVLGPLLIILYTSEMFELAENRRYVPMQMTPHYWQPADRLAVAASIIRDLASNQVRCNHWCIIMNLNKTKALVISRSRTVNLDCESS